MGPKQDQAEPSPESGSGDAMTGTVTSNDGLISGPSPGGPQTTPTISPAFTEPPTGQNLPTAAPYNPQAQSLSTPPPNTIAPGDTPADASTWNHDIHSSVAVQPTALTGPVFNAPSSNFNESNTPTSSFNGSQAFTPSPNPRKKKLLLALIAIVLIALAAGAFIFGYYLPNQPENVYSTGLDRTGDTLDELILNATEEAQLQRLQNAEITATADVKSQFSNFSGDFAIKLDKNSSDGSLTVRLKNEDETERVLKLKFLAELAESKNIPDFYFQLTGIQAFFGLDQMIPGIATYDGKWIAVSSDFIESISDEVTDGNPDKQDNVTSEEIASLIRTISSTGNEYLLTSDADKAVLENREFLGKEKLGDLNTYHYKVGLNVPNAITFCKVLSERVITHSAYQKLTGIENDQIETQKQEAAKDCDEELQKNYLENDPTFDMWIDAKYKLIHKIRLYDQEDKTTWYDIGQTYTGDDKLNIFVNYHNEAGKQDATFSVNIDLKSYVSKGGLTFTQTGEDSGEYTLNFEAKPYDGEVNTTVPPDAINIQEILNQLGFSGPSANPAPQSSIHAKAKDTEREVDIKSMHAQLEAFYAQNGFYPSNGEFNDAAWRAANIPGLDEEALKDPDGTTAELAIMPTSQPKLYGYQTSGCQSSGQQCQTYTLTARLSTGETYTKQSLN